MKLSIIVPVYKVEKYLHECVESILNQDFKDFELILVDDGSPDECGNLCDEYATRDRRVWVVHKSNGGLSSARNAGLDIATGEYIAFVDADDYVAPNYYSLAMQAFQQEPDLDMVEMPVVVYFNQPQKKIYSPAIQNTVRGKENIFATWIKNKGYLHAYSCNKVCRRGLYDNLRFPVGVCFEDTYTTPRLLEQCQAIRYIPYNGKKKNSSSEEKTGAYYYRQRKDSITTATSYPGFKDAMTHHLALFEQTKIPQLEKKTRNAYFLHLVNFYISMLRCKEASSKENIPFARECMTRLKKFRFRWISLLRTKLSLRTKLKNIPLALFGPEWHCFLYTGKWIKPITTEQPNQSNS